MAGAVRFVDACRRSPVDRPPVWLMRQAGRVLPEYRQARKSLSVNDIYGSPELSARLAAAAVERFGVDAAVVVTDIRLPLLRLGLIDGLDGPDDEPRPDPPLPAEWRRPDGDVFGQLAQSVTLTRQLCGPHAAVLGVVGAPFTLAASVYDARRPSVASRTKALMFGAPDAWAIAADHLTGLAVLAADVQVSAGAQALHVFDTWAGALDEDDYRAHVLPWSRRLFAALEHFGVPTIHYALGTAHLAEALRDAGGDVIGLDSRVDLDEAWDRIGANRGVQGNLDPTLLVGPLDRALEQAGEILIRAAGRPGHVFGLGHGLLPATSPGVLHTLVRYVHTFSA